MLWIGLLRGRQTCHPGFGQLLNGDHWSGKVGSRLFPDSLIEWVRVCKVCIGAAVR